MRRRLAICATLLVLLVAAGTWQYSRFPVSLDELRRRVHQSELESARDGLRRYLQAHAGDDRAWMLLAEVETRRGEPHAAIDCLSRISPDSPHRAEAWYRSGDLFWELGIPSKAEQSWRQLVPPHDPSGSAGAGDDSPRRHVWALGRLGDLFILENRIDEARATLWLLFDGFTDRDPARADFLFRLTVFDIQENDPVQAIETLEKFARSDPDDLQVKRALVGYYLRAAQPQAAAAMLAELLERDPANSRTRRTQLEYLAAIGDHAGLRAAIKQSPESPVADPELWRILAIDHENHREWQDATRCYEQAVRHNERDYRLRGRLAQVLRMAGQSDRSEAESLRVAETARVIKELSHFSGRFPAEPGDQIDSAQCLEFARYCTALGWTREANAWVNIAAARRNGRSDGHAQRAASLPESQAN